MILGKKRRNKITAVLIACLLLVGLFPASALAAEYDLTVNGNAITDKNAGDVLGDGTVSYDSGTNTLSLNSASVNRIVNSTGKALTITVTGENTVTLDSSAYTSGIELIDSNAPVTLNGSGSLTIDGTNRNLSVYGIGATGDVTVDGITLTMKSSNGAGISTNGNISVKNDALVQGDVQNMLYALNGKLTITGSEITMPLEGTDVAGWLGIYVKDMEISDSTVDIAAPCGISGTNSITIKDKSNVTVTSTIRTSSKYFAIWTNSGGSIDIENSTVSAVSTNYAAIYANNITITGGSVNAESKVDDPAIYAAGTLTINGPVTVETATAGSEVNYRGVAGTVIQTSTKSGDSMYEVYSGESEEQAAKVEGSPFAAATDVTQMINGVGYFRIEEHTHIGGTANCSSPAICDSCGNEYGSTDAANHTNLVKIQAKMPTHLTEGNKAYWRCDGCGKCYSDEAATQEIALTDTVIPKIAEHTADNTGWHSGENGHWQTCLCGEKLNEAAHTFAWIIDREATETEAGSRHEQCSVCGYAKAAVEIPATGKSDGDGTTNPQTGDASRLWLWGALFLMAGGVLAGTVIYTRKRSAGR